MPRMRRIHKKRDGTKKIVRITKQILVLVITFLLTIILVLAFSIGHAVWPQWIVEHRTQIAGILSFITICLIALSPIIVEANSKPRALSGPGRNPKTGWDP